jgi:hypothetical protein
MLGGSAARQHLRGAAEYEDRAVGPVAGGGDPVCGRRLGRARARRLVGAQCCFSMRCTGDDGRWALWRRRARGRCGGSGRVA